MKSIVTHLSLLLVVSICLILMACSPATHLYPGPERDHSELFSINISDARIDIDSAAIDGKKLTPTGRVYLLPGSHTATILFAETFEDANLAIPTGESSGVGLVKRAQCTINFSGTAGQSLIIYPSIGASGLLDGPPRAELSIRESGLFTPRLFTGSCQLVGSRVSVAL